MIPASEALQRLKEGNQRFASNQTDVSSSEKQSREDLVNSQSPFAIILGCSDSRVPAELVFDQGLGDLFVVRVAGNIVAPSLLGSIEFAAVSFGVQLVVVLGHSKCGAIQATINSLQQPSADHSPSLQFIVDQIKPSVESLKEAGVDENNADLLQQAIRTNVQTSMSHLSQDSQVLKELVTNKGLRIVGAEYSLDTGVVEFFDADL